MSTLSPPQNPETNPRVKSVFDDIRATRGSDFINNLFHFQSWMSKHSRRTSADVTDRTSKKHIAVSSVQGIVQPAQHHNFATD